MSRKRPEVLIVDDEVNFTLSVLEFLKNELRCYGAYSYEEAVEFLSKHPVDLVITDIKLPGKDGFDLLMWLRENQPDTKVIMITAYGSPSVKEKARASGALLYIEKPVDLNQLLRIVKEVFEKKGFDALLTELELADVLQFLAYYDRDLVIGVESDSGEKGRMGVKGGRIMWALTDREEGLDAFMKMMEWESGRFWTRPYYDEERGAIGENIMHLILEAMKFRDERSGEGGAGEIEFILKEENKRREAMPNLDEILVKFKGEIPEFMATAVVNLETGLYIAGIASDTRFDYQVASALYSEVIKAHEKGAEMLGGEEVLGETEDILITMEKVYILLRKLGKKHYHGLAITRKGNLGLSRVIMKKYEPFLMEALKELGEI